MKCPHCDSGTVYVYTPIVYGYDVKEDGTIVETDRLSNRIEEVEVEAVPRIRICQAEKIFETLDKDTVIWYNKNK